MTKRERFASSLILSSLIALGTVGSVQAVDRGILDPEAAERASRGTARDIDWETSLPAAQARAKQLNKPIFWVHMLGNVDGYT